MPKHTGSSPGSAECSEDEDDEEHQSLLQFTPSKEEVSEGEHEQQETDGNQDAVGFPYFLL